MITLSLNPSEPLNQTIYPELPELQTKLDNASDRLASGVWLLVMTLTCELPPFIRSFTSLPHRSRTCGGGAVTL